MADLIGIIEQFSGYFPLFYRLAGVIFFVLGVVFAIKALLMSAKKSEQGPGSQTSWMGPIMMFFTGVMFLAFWGLQDTLTQTFFGDFGFSTPPSADSIFAHAPATIGIFDGDEARTIIIGITTIIQFIGIIAVARGLYMLNLSAQGAGNGPKTFGPGLTFVIAGAMAANFPLFMAVMESLITTS